MALNNKSNGKSNIRRAVLIIAAALLSFLVAWIAWGNTALMISEYTVASEKLPQELSGLRIAQISDLHNAEFGNDNARLVAMLEKAEPDIIVITGDFVDSYSPDVEISLAFAKKVVSIAPTYYVNGNHEARLAYSTEYEQLRNGLLETGVTVLENEAQLLEINGAFLNIVGINDPNFSGSGWYDAAATVSNSLDMLLSENEYNVVLSHRPELFDAYEDSGADVVFTGHAHGGQIRLPFIGGLGAPNQGFFPKYDAGTFTSGCTTMIVSRGLGNSIIPLRVNNRPEIVVVTLDKEL